MFIGNYEVTLREVIFSITIVAVLYLIGFFIAGHIEHSANSKNLEYRQAAQISNTNEFAYALKTDIGNAFIQGKFEAVDTVSHNNLSGDWLHIVAEYEKYTMHTRMVTTSNGKGGTRTYLHTYWTWDRYDLKRLHSKFVKFGGIVFPYDTFSYDYAERKSHRVKIGNGRRITFTALYPRFNATVYSNLKDGKLIGENILMKDMSIKECYDSYTKNCGLVIFWSIWILFMCAAVVIFVIHENGWIEDKKL